MPSAIKICYPFDEALPLGCIQDLPPVAMPRAVRAAPGRFTCIAAVRPPAATETRALGASRAEPTENVERSIGIAPHPLERPRGCSQIGQRGTRSLDTEPSEPSHRSSLKPLGFSVPDRHARRESITEIERGSSAAAVRISRRLPVTKRAEIERTGFLGSSRTHVRTTSRLNGKQGP
jgi:hypothetical protein